jgi:cobalt-zinc-cadmium efflux system protein
MNNVRDHSTAAHTHDASVLSGMKILWVTLLNALITATEIVGGLLSGSLSLLSDAVHNLSDTFAIALSYIANRIAQKPKDAKRTYGYKRAEILAAFVNSSVLMIISTALIVEAIRKFSSPEAIKGSLMIIVASIGLVANLVSVFFLEKDSHENLNIKSSYLHLLGDTVSSVGVLFAGVAIKLWGIVWIDPVVTLLISLYIIKQTWQVIKKTVDILMQSSAVLDYEAIAKDVEAIPEVNNIHHVHSWMVNENTIYFEAHVDMVDMTLCEADVILDRIEHLLKEKYDVTHTTLQAEADKCPNKSLIRT